MVIEMTKGDIVVRYNSEDWNKKQSRLKIFRDTLMAVTFALLMIVGAIVLTTKLEEIGAPFAVTSLLTLVSTVVALGLVVYYCVKIAYRKYIPAYQTIDWFSRLRDVKVGYFRNKLLFMLDGGSDSRSLKYILSGIKNEHIIDESEVKDKQDNIVVEFDFTDATKTIVKVRNT